MARMGCKCGATLSNGLTPNDIQYWVYSDRKMDKIRENDAIDVLELSIIEDYEVWLCPDCKRLYIFENPHKPDTPAKYIYRLETE